jgi:hypothetical protein
MEERKNTKNFGLAACGKKKHSGGVWRQSKKTYLFSFLLFPKR